MKNKIIEIVLWLAFILAMGASVQHLAWTFGTVERPGFEWLGWIPAIAVDAGLASLAYTIQQRKRAKKPVVILWCGVIGFALVSAGANFYHALAVEGFALVATPIMIAKAVVLSATLPVAYIFLGEIISGDDATAADRAAKQSEREQRRLDLQAEREAKEAARLLLEAENEQKRLALDVAVPVESEPMPIVCGACGRSFRSVNARNAHKCEVKIGSNGKAHAAQAGR